MGQHAADDQQRHGRDDAHDAVERGISARVTGPGGNTTAVGKSNSGDLYAGHDGNVYKKDASGGYQKYDNGSWSSVQQPTQAQKQQAQTQATPARPRAGANPATMSQVQSDAAARTQGAQRTNTYSGMKGAAGHRAPAAIARAAAAAAGGDGDGWRKESSDALPMKVVQTSESVLRSHCNETDRRVVRAVACGRVRTETVRDAGERPAAA